MYSSYNYGVAPYQNQMLQGRTVQQEQMYSPVSYQQQYQFQQQPQQQVQAIKGRPVSSYDEAKASMIDLDGSLFVFTDVANKKIYTKQIMLDGSAEFKTYKLVEEQSRSEKEIEGNSDRYVLKTEFEKAMKQINDKIKGVVVNDAEDV